MKAVLALEDGRIFEGSSFGADGECLGEVVFNTSMTGYQEILTDPSYKSQIVTMTYPQIGNYGVNLEDVESSKPQVEGFIVRENSRIYSNWRSKNSLENYLKENNIIGLEEVDTRAIVRHIRIFGAMKGVISTVDFDKESLVRKVKEYEGIVGKDLVKKVTCKEKYIYSKDNKYKVVALDFGIKTNILRCLEKYGCNVTVVPASTSAKEILEMETDGIFLSNGPGDPAGVSYAAKTVERLVGKRPIFGICLGHQILALALGEKTYKLKFGHRGGNQPVKDLKTGKIEITSQNHGFCVKLNSSEFIITHINLNDDTIEGMEHKDLPIFSVQYHPEASPGPHDANYLFKRFIEMMERWKER